MLLIDSTEDLLGLKIKQSPIAESTEEHDNMLDTHGRRP